MGQYTSQAAEEKRALATGHGFLLSLYVVNVSASTKYIYLYDNASAASGTILSGPFPVGAGQALAIEFTSPIEFALGAYLASSSTLETYTATSTSDFRINSYTTAAG